LERSPQIRRQVMADDLPDEDEQEEEQAPRVPMVTVPGLNGEAPFQAPADVASQWDFRDWRRA
jgi:hypothetical protein